MSSPHSSRLQIYRSFTIRLFRVISRILVRGVLPLCRDAVGVFYKPKPTGKKSWYAIKQRNKTSRLGHRTLVVGVVPLLQRCSRCILQPSRQAHRTIVGGVVPLCRDAVGVFYSTSQLGHRTLISGVVPLYSDVVGQFCNRLDHFWVLLNLHWAAFSQISVDVVFFN